MNRGHRDANIDSIYYYAVFYPAIEVIGALSTAMIIWFGGNWVLGGTLSLGAFVAFVLYAQRFYRPISDLSEKFNILQAAMASSERIFKLLDTPPRDRERNEPPAVAASATGRPPSRAPTGHIVFENVSFAYNGTDSVLQNVSFEVKPGERVGVVGATGAGKSTIINLLLRFYDVTGGRITVDGVDIREMDLQALRRLFSLVLQDVHLFSGTIASNIRLGEARSARGCAAGGSGGPRTASSKRCPAATPARSPNAAPRCRSARSSCCRLPARWPSIRASWCWTRRRPASIPRRNC